MSKYMHRIGFWFRVGLGYLLAIFGFLGTGFGIIGILDPVGSKMADDSDPLGPPLPFVQALVLTLIYVGMLCLGIWLICKRSKTTPQL
jgi:hypothetical protein